MKPNVCDLCGKPGPKIRKMTRTIGKGKQAFLIEGVPIVACPNCGETYLTAETMREIERIRLRRGRLTERRVIAVARFGAA